MSASALHHTTRRAAYCAHPPCLEARLFVSFWFTAIIGNDTRKKLHYNNHFTISAHPEIKCRVFCDVNKSANAENDAREFRIAGIF
jgi:hypothetical protein